MQTVIETPAYLVDAERLFTLEERNAVVDTVAFRSGSGVVIPGSGGIRKLLRVRRARQEWRRAGHLSIRWNGHSGVSAYGVCEE
jgi:hypothetical protein